MVGVRPRGWSPPVAARWVLGLALCAWAAGASVTVELGVEVKTTVNADPSWPAATPRAATRRGTSKYQQLKVVVMMEGICRETEQVVDEEAELECLHSLFAACTALSPRACFQQVMEQDPTCARVFVDHGADDYKQWWQTVFIRAVPALRRLGWADFSVIRGFRGAWQSADVVVMRYNGDAGALEKLFREGKPTQKYVLLDRGDSTTLSPGYSSAASLALVENPRVAAILRQTIVWPRELQNGPLYYGKSHLGKYVQQSVAEYRSFSNATLHKVHARLPTTVRYRFPWACGSTREYTRFAGFFHPSLQQHWVVPPLRERQYDVAFLGKIMYRGGAGAVVTQHRRRILAELEEFSRRFEGRFKVLSPWARESDYPRYLETLKQVKVFISPWGWGEWSGKDYEAIMAGCLLVKPMLGNIRQYPDIYQPGVTAFSMDAPPHGRGNLTYVLLRSLVDLDRSQAIVDRAAGVVRGHAEPDAYAADLSDLLVASLREADLEIRRRGSGAAGKRSHSYRQRGAG